jgi:hypothetical protein
MMDEFDIFLEALDKLTDLDEHEINKVNALINVEICEGIDEAKKMLDKYILREDITSEEDYGKYIVETLEECGSIPKEITEGNLRFYVTWDYEALGSDELMERGDVLLTEYGLLEEL